MDRSWGVHLELYEYSHKANDVSNLYLTFTAQHFALKSSEELRC